MKKRIKFKKILLPLLAGFFAAIGRLPIHLGLLSAFTIIPLLMLFEDKCTFKQLIGAGFFYSFAYVSVALPWINLVTIPGFLGLYLLFTFYFAILFGMIYNISLLLPRLRFMIFALFWISFDYLQNFGEFRFPWFDLGYALADYNILIQPAEIGGVYLITLMLLLIGFVIYNLQNNIRLYSVILITILFVWIGYGHIRLNTLNVEETEKKLAIVQPSIPQEMKWDRTILDSTIQLYKEMTKEAAVKGADLVLWPESAWPVYLNRQMKYKLQLLHLVADIELPVVTGFPDYNYLGDKHPESYEFFNSASIFYPDGEIGEIYHKNYLVPVGERIPLLDVFPVLWKLHLGQANFEYGNKLVYYDYDELRFSPQICFEIAFSKQTATMASNETDVILNLTNDAWFHKSYGTYQHAVLSKFRAVETRTQIFRAANTGYSLIVSPTGEILQKSELFDKTIMIDNILLCDQKTFFTKHINLLPKLFLLLSLLIIVAAVYKRIRGL